MTKQVQQASHKNSCWVQRETAGIDVDPTGGDRERERERGREGERGGGGGKGN